MISLKNEFRVSVLRGARKFRLYSDIHMYVIICMTVYYNNYSSVFP